MGPNSKIYFPIPNSKRNCPSFFPADSLVHFHVLVVAEAASRGDQLGPLHFNQQLLEIEEAKEEGS